MSAPANLLRRWGALPARDRRAVGVALLVLGLALVWWLGIAPAWSTLRGAAAQRQAVDAQVQQMLRLQMQAQALQASPRIPPEQARRQLEASMVVLGSGAQLVLSGERASVSLKGCSADALALWLAQVRVNARSVPSEAHLVRNAAGLWDGSLILNLGAR